MLNPYRPWGRYHRWKFRVELWWLGMSTREALIVSGCGALFLLSLFMWWSE